MTTFVLVHGAWHGPSSWDRVVPVLHAAGARTLTPDLSDPGDHGLHDHAEAVVAEIDAAIDAADDRDELILVGHSYAGLVVREAADLRPQAIDHIVLVDGWAGADGAGMLTLAPPDFTVAVLTAAEVHGDGRRIPAPPPELFGVVDPDDVAWLAQRLLPQPLRTFTETTHLSGAVDRIPGTAIYCTPQTYPFDRFGKEVGYRTLAMEGPHDVMLTHPYQLARLLMETTQFGSRKPEV
ncbi:alpha/beta hydrolase [Nonomuraea cavernae]|uniref:Esterase n=1 Tax=Nonomuraea cavernae TaxID=2045107 RepID=A0A917YX45_9ACTN|nr:alpha/beta hydrolase [Nonomuraea cavernae]MCA2185983.1 alpha/beta hydrolase [Nonomuraea cavernae]GGO69040.1 esterase [Nonomuraea cavernae]